MDQQLRTPEEPRLRRGLRVIVITVGVFVLAVAILVAVGLPLYVFPAVSSPTKADAIIVLGPPAKYRVAFAESLMDQGYAGTLVLSTKPETSKWDDVESCAEQRAYRVICFVADPHTTQGEAREIRDLAADNGWDHVLVITIRSHVTRARVIIDRCYTGDVDMVASPKRYDPAEWIEEYLYQTGAFVKVALAPSC